VGAETKAGEEAEMVEMEDAEVADTAEGAVEQPGSPHAIPTQSKA